MAGIRMITAATAATLSLLFAGCAFGAVQMLSPADPSSAGPLPKSGKSLVPVRFHADEIFQLAPGTEVEVPLPNGNRQSYVFERAIDHGGGIRTWIGKSTALDGGHRAVITSSPAGTWGWMSSQYGQFRLYPGDGSDWLGQAPRLDLSPKFAGGDAISGPPDAPALAPLKGIPTSAPAGVALGSMAKLLVDVKQVDVMFVYSKDLAQKLGAGLTPMLFNVIASANQAYVDSQVAFTLRLVNATMLDVPNTAASGDVLDAMNNGNAGAHASLNTMFRDITWSSGTATSIRDRVGADVAAFVRDGPDDTGGIGFLLKNPTMYPAVSVVASYAYSVSNYCASGCEGIVTHEIGHNMGDHHDRATIVYDSANGTLDDSGVFPYSYGMYSCNTVNTGFLALTCNPATRPMSAGCNGSRPTCSPSSPNDFGTVMSYFSPQLLRFSNPLQADCHAAGGVSALCGVTGQDDNTQSMNNVRQNVSAYRTQVVASLPGAVQFDSLFYSGSEASGSLVFHVVRVNGSMGAINVQYTATSGTATAGTDFSVASGILSWADGDASTKNITIPLVNDGFAEGNETFTVTLSNPTGAAGIYVGYPSAATGVITEPFPTGSVGSLPTGFASGSGSSASWGIASDSSADGDGLSLKSGLIDFTVKACTDPVYGSVPCPSSMQYAATLGAGNLGFAYKVSAYPGFGFLEFYIDGTLLLQGGGSSANTSADSGWQYFSTPVTAGTHTLLWKYRPALSFQCAHALPSGASTPPYPLCADRAWVDELTLPFVMAASTASLSSNANPSSTGQSVTFTASVAATSGTPTGSVSFNDGGTPISTCASVSLASGVATCTTSALAAGVHTVTAVYGGSASYSGAISPSLMQAVSAGPLLLSAAPTPLDFGGQSMNTTTPALDVVITNTSASPVTPTSITATSGYSIAANGCTAAIARAGNCTISLTFTPGSAGVVSGLLSVAYASGGPTYAALTGTGERSLVTHYYRSILRRAPDTAGHDFWQSEATRVTGLGANVNETWYALAMSFFNSQEYANFHTDNAGYLNDLYRTFFNRAPDSGGFAFWLDQMAQGMPRDAVLASFMFSPEFKNFTEAIFGTSTVRAEIDMSMDMYRGTLARLPDSAGFNFYLGQFRTAQCQGASTVRTQAGTVSAGFLDSAEYSNRQRTNAQYMSDLYNTFMRRGPDLAGITFYIGQLDSAAQTRQQLRAQFLASPEFTNRVTGVVNAGCAP